MVKNLAKIPQGKGYLDAWLKSRFTMSICKAAQSNVHEGIRKN